MTTVPTRDDAADFARRHGIRLTAELVDTTSAGDETWRVEAEAPNGTLTDTVETDGSFTPDPFDWFFGVWANELPDDDEYFHVGEILGPEALRDLAEMLRWIPA